jgi:hypothetical protein
VSRQSCLPDLIHLNLAWPGNQPVQPTTQYDTYLPLSTPICPYLPLSYGCSAHVVDVAWQCSEKVLCSLISSISPHLNLISQPTS